MKYLKLLLPILFSSALTSAQRIVHVFDADTYRLLDHDKLKIIRLANVDAPELNQFYGPLAKACVSKLILGQIVTLEVIKKDLYGRTVANVKMNNISLDSLLVAKGWAWHYPRYSSHRNLSLVQLYAIKDAAGMWICKHNIPPWVWRPLNKNEKRLKEMCR